MVGCAVARFGIDSQIERGAGGDVEAASAGRFEPDGTAFARAVEVLAAHIQRGAVRQCDTAARDEIDASARAAGGTTCTGFRNSDAQASCPPNP